MRAVLGKGTRTLLAKYCSQANFAAPDVAFVEAGKRLPEVIRSRRLSEAPFMEYFAWLSTIVQTVEFTAYCDYEAFARILMEKRDVDDWPILAAALALDCPIWTEDMDFFGCGVATWTTDRVDLYLADAVPIPC
jgi:predicted nucleic acid-binding protein